MQARLRTQAWGLTDTEDRRFSEKLRTKKRSSAAAGLADTIPGRQRTIVIHLYFRPYLE